MLLAHLPGVCNGTAAYEIVHAQLLPCCRGAEAKVAFRAALGQPAHCSWLKDAPIFCVCCPRKEKGCTENGKLEGKMSDPRPEATSCDKSAERTTTG